MPWTYEAYDVHEAYEAHEAEFSGGRGGRTPSTAHGAVPLPRRGRSGGADQGLRPCRRLRIGALRSPLSPFARPFEAFYTTPGTNGRTMRAPTGYGGATNCCNDKTQHCKCISLLRFPPRCRGAHRAPADILLTLDFPIPRPPSSREGDRRSGGRSPQRWKE